MSDYKYQLNIFAGQQSFIFRTDDPAEVAKFTGVKDINAELLTDYVIKLDNKTKLKPPLTPPPNQPEIKQTAAVATSNNIIDPNIANCLHQNTKTKALQGKWGPYQMQICLDCNMVRFSGKNKAGHQYWKEWIPGKKQIGDENLPY